MKNAILILVTGLICIGIYHVFGGRVLIGTIGCLVLVEFFAWLNSKLF